MALRPREREMLPLARIMEDKRGGTKAFGDGGCGLVVTPHWKGR